MNGGASGKKILVLGAGNFGTCLGQHLADQGAEVVLWTIEAAVADAINTSHKNPKYLSTLNLSSRLRATTKIDSHTLEGIDAVVAAVPTQGLRDTLQYLKPFWSAELLLVCAAKGIEIGTQKLPGDVIGDVLGAETARKSAFLSGPSFAVEVAQKLPTCVAMASQEPDSALAAQALFHASHFRVYTSDDPVGLEVAGALKNVVAIATGAAAGLGLQMNSRAALITRGLAEITRFGMAMGAQRVTFQGLGGVGDLFLTCTSEKSRNYTVGFMIGQGKKLDDILAELGSVSEGVATAKAAYNLAKHLGIDAPISGEVYRVLYEDKPIEQAIQSLVNREAKPEFP